MAGLTKIKTGGFAAGCALPSDATATTQSANDNSTKLATTAYVDSATGGIASDSITEGNTTVEVVDTGSDGHITFDTDGNEAARIDNSGRMLFGRTTSIEPHGRIVSQAFGLGVFSAFTNRNDASSGEIYLNRSRGSASSPTILQNNDQVGAIQFRGYDGGDYRSTAQIVAEIDGDPGSSDMPGRLVFQTTADGAISASERMRIDSSGRVGIGATDNSVYSGSSDNLVIKDSGNAGLTIHSGSSSTGCIRFADGTSSNAEKLDAAIEYNHSTEKLEFRTNDTARITIVDSTGNVGINDSSPDLKLHVRNDNSAAAKFGGHGGNEYYMEIGQLGSSSSPGFNATGTTASMLFQVAGTERMRIMHTSGNVGIGISNNTTYKLQVAGTSSGNQFAIGDQSPRLILDYKSPSTTTVCPQITSNGEGLYYFGKNNNGNSAHKFYAGSSNSHKATIDGDGLKFNGDTSSVNALDDYEEGTWSPNFHSNSSSNQVTYDVREGTYTKIGNTVYIRARVTYTNRGSTDSTHNARMAGLPFTSKNTQGGFYYVMPVSRPSNNGDVDLYLLSGNSTTGIFARATTAVAQWADFDTATNGTGGYMICGSYLAA